MFLPKRKNRIMSAVVLGALDGCGLLCAYLWAVYEALPWSLTYVQGALSHIPYFGIFLLFWYGAAFENRLFGFRRDEELTSYLFAVTKAVANALVFSTVVMALFSGGGVEHRFLLPFSFGIPIAILVLRAGVRIGAEAFRRGGYALRHVLVIGANNRTDHLLDVIAARGKREYQVDGYLEDDPERLRVLDRHGIPHLGGVGDLEKILDTTEIHEVYICLPVRSHYETIQRIAYTCENARISVRFIADLFPLRIATSRLIYVEDIPLLSLSAIPETRARLAVKRAVDLFVSTILLVLLSPVFLLVAILIKLESSGPIFFAQERMGQNQRRFKMLKFRSMVANAEQLRKNLEAMNEADGPVFKIRRDPRITRVGRYLRRYSVDEFPQLINVWLGQMSLVGPRPPIPSEVEQYTWVQRRRLSVRPGMTGLWQVSGRSDVNFSEWVEMDLTYIDTWSLRQDFVILLKTFGAVVHGRGAA